MRGHSPDRQQIIPNRREIRPYTPAQDVNMSIREGARDVMSQSEGISRDAGGRGERTPTPEPLEASRNQETASIPAKLTWQQQFLFSWPNKILDRHKQQFYLPINFLYLFPLRYQ